MVAKDPDWIMEQNTSLVLVRRPIFDDQQKLWGYELRCLHGGRTAEGSEAADQALSCLASSAYIGLQEVSDRGKRLVVPFGEKAVLDQIPYALPPALAAVEISEGSIHPREVQSALEELKSNGYLLALAGFSGDSRWEKVYGIADILCVRVAGTQRPAETARRLRSYPGQLLARGISDRALLSECQEAGFQLFQGGYFKSPEDVPVRRITSNEVARLRLMGLIEEGDPDFPKLAEAIQSDAALSFRLLGYLNSAAFGFRQNIKSIRQAITLLGWTRMRQWLRVAILSDMGQTTHASELVYLAAQRGRFLELLGQRFDYWGFDPESLQMLGLFSLLDAMLAMPMSEAVRYLPVEEKLKGALRRETNNEYLPLLELAEALEDGNTALADAMIGRLGLEADGVRHAYQSAVAWANQLLASG